MNSILELRPTLAECERKILEDALKAKGTNRQRAKALGIAPRTFYYRCRRHGLNMGTADRAQP